MTWMGNRIVNRQDRRQAGKQRQRPRISTFVGVYDVRVTVPAGISPGDQVPVYLVVAGQTSATVTMAVAGQ